MTVTDSRRTGTSIYNISRVKQTTGWRRRSETPANLRGGLGRARAATGTTGMAATARLGPAHRLPAIRDGVGVAMLPLPVAPKATAGGKRCGQDRWLSTTSTSRVWFLGGLGFRLPPQSLSASLRRQRAAKLLPRHTNQACSSQKNTGKEKKKNTPKNKRAVPGRRWSCGKQGVARPAAGWDGRDGGGGCAGSWDGGDGGGWVGKGGDRRGRGDRGTWGRAQPMEPGSCQPDFICISYLRPRRAPGGVSKTHVFQDIPPKENCSALLRSRTCQANCLEEPFPRPHSLLPLQGKV